MALTTCQECGGKVSTWARACPHCGAPPMGPWRKVLLAIVAAAFAVAIATLLSMMR